MTREQRIILLTAQITKARRDRQIKKAERLENELKTLVTEDLERRRYMAAFERNAAAGSRITTPDEREARATNKEPRMSITEYRVEPVYRVPSFLEEIKTLFRGLL